MSQSIAIAMEVLAEELETAEAALAGNSSDAEHEALYGLAEAARDVIEVGDLESSGRCPRPIATVSTHAVAATRRRLHLQRAAGD